MEIVVDQDQKWLIDCLTATLDTSRDIRSFAEASLQQASLQPGFGIALAKVTVNKQVPFGLRQLAAVLLKQFIKQHWQEEEENFVQPAVSMEEKGVIRQLLLPSLDDPHGKMRTAIGMAVASIAQHDWPEDWPELLPFLLNLISDQNNGDRVRGALRCLALICDDWDNTSVPKLVPTLFPCLHKIITSPHLYEKSLRTKSLSIVNTFFAVLGSMSGVYKTESITLITPMLNSLMEQFSIILQIPVQSEDPDDWCIRMAVLKCLLQLVLNFPSLMVAQLPVIVAPLWQTFVSSIEVYQLASVQGGEDSYSGAFDSDGGEKSLESFVIQLFEFLLTIVGNSRMSKIVGRNIKELVYYTISFLQITEEQVHTWSMDANQYVADEDDGVYSCRVSGSLLLEEVVNAYGLEGINSIIEAAQKRFSESCGAKAAGSADWWRLHEASLFALCSLSEQLLEAQASGLTNINIGKLLDQMIMEDGGTGLHEYPFLHARAFTAVSKFSSVINRSLCEKFLYSATHVISVDVAAPVKVGACRALSELLRECNQTVIQPHIMGLLLPLTNLLNQASDETLHIVLETLQAAVKAGHEQATTIEPIVSPIIFNVWASHVSDPFISIDAVEVLEEIKNAPGCMRPLVSRILPYIGTILEKVQLQPLGLVAGSLDMLTMILKNAPVDVLKATFDLCFNSTIQIMLESDDHSEIQNATECLVAFLSGGRQELLAWGGDPGLTMKRLLDAASRLLHPDMESSGSLFVANYFLTLILHFPSQLSVYIGDLVAAVVRRMQSCNIIGLKSSLIVILARLVHLSVPDVAQFIHILRTIPADNHENALHYVMSEWTKLQEEIQGAYHIKVTATALALLLSAHHSDLVKLNVQGHRLIKTNAGITTRSKAKIAPDQWTVIPLPVKIFAILSDTLVEIQEQAIDFNDEDSEWEEDFPDDSGVPQDILYSSSVPSNRSPAVEHLDAMAKALNETEDGFEDEFMKADPLYNIKMADFLGNFFVGLSNSNKPLFDYLCQSLTSTQRTAIEKVVG